MNTLPVMSIRDAIKTRTERFLCARRCKECGSFERYCASFSCGFIFCEGCFPQELQVKSCKEVKLEEKRRNEELDKTKKKNWGIPVVFGGFNTI